MDVLSYALGKKSNEKHRYSSMPVANNSNTNKIIQYTGESNNTYTKGYFYKCVHTSVEESITITETDDNDILDNLSVNSTTFKSKVNNAGTYKFKMVGYPTKINYSNISVFPPVMYSLTRDNTFDQTAIMSGGVSIYSWVDDANNFYVTDTLNPGFSTTLYSYDIQTGETTDTGAMFLSSSEPSSINGYWCIVEDNTYTPVDLSDYGITMSTSGFPGNEITVAWSQASDNYNWEQIDVQPGINNELANISNYDSTKNQVLKNVNGTFTWVDES